MSNDTQPRQPELTVMGSTLAGVTKSEENARFLLGYLRYNNRDHSLLEICFLRFMSHLILMYCTTWHRKYRKRIRAAQ